MNLEPSALQYWMLLLELSKIELYRCTLGEERCFCVCVSVNKKNFLSLQDVKKQPGLAYLTPTP